MSVKIVKNLESWFKREARTLPWRTHPDPYRVWLSEIMLQQTQVATVVPYFNRFLDRFPQVRDLAQAPLDEVLKLWAGLGYYSRARNLHRAAQVLSQGFPEDREGWLKIPGVGPYTAGAILSIAYNRPEALVDGNVVRVLSRLYALSQLDAAKTEIWTRSERLVRLFAARAKVKPRIFNQALMELGALVCTPKSPRCSECPVASQCKGKNTPEAFPAPKPKKVWKSLTEKCWVILAPGPGGGHQVLLGQNPEGGWRSGLWDFPRMRTSPVARAEWLMEFHLQYVVTRHRVHREHRVYRIPRAASSISNKLQWFPLSNLPGVPAPVRKALEHLSENLGARF